MTVKEYIEESKKKIKVDDVYTYLDAISDYAKDTYEYDISKEYKGLHTLETDPWIKDIITCEKAIDIIKAMIFHIENFEEDAANYVLKGLGVKR